MYTAKDIDRVNTTLKKTDVKGKPYVEVNERIRAFRSLCSGGMISTEILFMENGVVTMKATICDEDGKVLATGLAQEKESSSYINKTSYIENCETSAVGRALGMCGFGIEGSVASAEEVTNAINNQGKPKKTSEARQALVEFIKADGLDMTEVAKEFKLNGNTTDERFTEVLNELFKRSMAKE